MKIELISGDFLFTGSHEKKVRSLINVIDTKSQSKIFNSAVEVFIIAARVGCINNRTAEKEKGDETLRIMVSQFNTHRTSLLNTYKLVLLCADSNNVSPVDRINRAFREYSEDYNFNLFISYVLGGVDELYSVFVTTINSDEYYRDIEEEKICISVMVSFGMKSIWILQEKNERKRIISN